MKKSNFTSPVYGIQKIPVSDIVAQKINPNTLNTKEFNALQISIRNSGFTMCATGCVNSDYDPSSEIDPLEKIRIHIEGSENDTRSGGQHISYATNIDSDDVRKMFKYKLIDGAQRTALIRLGTYYFYTYPNVDNLVNEWEKGNVPENPGKFLLMFLAWREDFCVPMSINQGKTEIEEMSMTILSNVAKGNHDFETVKKIVLKLINNGCTKEWISQNLFLDVDSVEKIIQLQGISEIYKDYDETEAWIPEEDPLYKERKDVYLDRQALQYLRDYVKKNKAEILTHTDNIEEWKEIVDGKKD